MEGKTVVITGASAGIGAIAASALAQRGATVVPVGRSPEKTAAVAEAIGVEPLVADFAELDQVRRLAAQLLERCPRIDVLANNAGGVFPRREVTPDGHELTIQVNHLAAFLLTALLRERLETTGAARVINTASVANRFGRIDVCDLDYERRRWGSFRAYAASKLANVLFTRELARRLARTDVTSVCFHPGTVASEFGRDSWTVGLPYRVPALRRLLLVSPERGSEPLVDLAARGDIADFHGVYFDRRKPHGAVSPQADEPERGRELWQRSAAMLGTG